MKYATQRKVIKSAKGTAPLLNHEGAHNAINNILDRYYNGDIQLIACVIEGMDGQLHSIWAGEDSIIKRLGIAEMLKQDIYQIDVVEASLEEN